MIRLVNIRADDDVIYETPCFSWFDTVANKFLEFGGCMAWETWSDFESDCGLFCEEQPDIERFKSLFKGRKVGRVAKRKVD